MTDIKPEPLPPAPIETPAPVPSPRINRIPTPGWHNSRVHPPYTPPSEQPPPPPPYVPEEG